VQSKGHGRQVLHDVGSHGGYLLQKIRSAFPCQNCPQHEVCPARSRVNLGIQNQGLNPDIGVRSKKKYVLRNDTLILLGFLYPRTSMCQLSLCLALNPKPYTLNAPTWTLPNPRPSSHLPTSPLALLPPSTFYACHVSVLSLSLSRRNDVNDGGLCELQQTLHRQH
jgi:hypothetical protein